LTGCPVIIGTARHLRARDSRRLNVVGGRQGLGTTQVLS